MVFCIYIFLTLASVVYGGGNGLRDDNVVSKLTIPLGQSLAKKGVRYLQSQEGFRDVSMTAELVLDSSMDIKGEERLLRKQAENIFESYKALLDYPVWCASLQDLCDLDREFLPQGSDEYRALLRLMLYYDLGDIPYAKTSFFMGPQKPKSLPERMHRV